MNAKPILILIAFIMFLALFAGQSIGSTDLTPDTPYVAPASGSSNFSAVGGVYSGACGASYTVAKGDTLSQISRYCGVTVANILALNPAISNPNLIQPGQVITIYVPVTPVPTVTTAPSSPLSGVLPVTGLAPGGVVMVDIIHFPPLTKVSVHFGPQGGTMELVKEVQVDRNGEYHGNMGIPPTAKPGEKWVIVITSTSNPAITTTSEPFLIGQ